MNCQQALDNIVLAQYGELDEGAAHDLEHHLAGCEDCRREYNAHLALNEELGALPMVEPSPNQLAASRMRLDEALDALPPATRTERILGSAWRWAGFLQGAPALATLLVGVGFIGGNVLVRYQLAHQAKTPPVVILSNSSQGAIANVTGIEETPNHDVVSIHYNRLVPETAQGSLDDPQMRELLMMGSRLAASPEVHADSVALLASECKAGHSCDGDYHGSAGIRTALLASLRTDPSPQVRLKALEGLQPYVAKDQQVRNALLEALLRDRSADVRSMAIALLGPVQADSSVRRVLRAVSEQDANPGVRNASNVVLQDTENVQ